MTDFVAKKVWFDKDRIFIETDNKRVLSQPILYYRKLAEATDQQKEEYKISLLGIHWEDLDEDVSFESFEYDNSDPTELQRFFLTHREVNIAEFAKRAGINATLLRNYINGFKKPSKEREQEILFHIHQMGKEFMSVAF